MQFALTSLLLAVSAAVAMPTSHIVDPDAFTPGLAVHPRCKSLPSGNVCPAKLKSGNALVTSKNIVIRDSRERPGANIIRAGWSLKDSKLVEESTFTVFDFPAGHEDKRCRFQFVSDGGDNLDAATDIYNVWSFEAGSGEASEKSTITDRPKREKVVAAFTTRETVFLTENKKNVHKFLFGPGEGSATGLKGLDGQPLDSFPCPAGGKFAWEVASAIKNNGFNSTMNIGGASGLGIEIIGLKAEAM